MNKTGIPWCDFTWNPATGCTRGCDYCYARKVAARFGQLVDADDGSMGTAAKGDVFPFGFSPTMYPHRLDEPLRRKKPSVIFLGSMGDLFDPAFPDSFRDQIFMQAWAAKRHTFMLLTKQAENMRRYFERTKGAAEGWRLDNLWLGVTVTNQADADERIPLLLDTPAAHRFVSVEPMLGPVDIGKRWESIGGMPGPGGGCYSGPGIDCVVVGSKTPGPALHEPDDRCGDAAPLRCDCPPVWLRSLRDQCLAAGVPFHYKHGGTNPALDSVTYDWRPGVENG